MQAGFHRQAILDASTWAMAVRLRSSTAAMASCLGPRGPQGSAESRRGQYREPFCVISGNKRPLGVLGAQRCVWVKGGRPVGSDLSPVLASLSCHCRALFEARRCKSCLYLGPCRRLDEVH